MAIPRARTAASWSESAVELDSVLTEALRECSRNGVTGAVVTPFVLGRIATVTEGRSIPAR
jgi:pseudouridine-5'-phosphate glycosidase